MKSQEIDRRALETAARRDEIQELERNLKQEQEALERRKVELEALEQKILGLQDPSSETDEEASEEE